MLVVVGRLGRPHGIRGELTVEIRTDEPELRLAAGTVLATEPEAAGPLTVVSAHRHGDRMLLRLAGVEDRSAAEGLRGVLLQAEVDPQERPTATDEYYDHQLVGLTVQTTEGVVVGQIAEVVHLPGQELLAVRREGRDEVLVPFVAELVPSVDLGAGTVVIAPPPGLLELDQT